MVFQDQLNREIELTNFPKRIISLVPSQTELLFDLGLEKEIIGITKFCIHPTQWFKLKKRIGGTKNIDIELVKKLKPNLIIANKEENTKEQIEQLFAIAPVWISDINCLLGAYDMIEKIGIVTKRVEAANKINQEIQLSFQHLSKLKMPKNVCYLIWQNPYMTVGGDTFINDILQTCGLKNVFSNYNRYPIIATDEIKDANPEIIFLSSEPYPFKAKHIDTLQQQFPNTNIKLVNGEMFSWYGSRLLKTVKYFNALLKEI
jgi:ABC-type Fe3+-hydroxamate transport system substrate-binding protein